MSFLHLLMIVITNEEFWSTGVAVEVLDKKNLMFDLPD
jgi:hypothetical protein